MAENCYISSFFIVIHMIITVKEGFNLYDEKICIEKMQFNIVNRYPQYSKKEFETVKTEIEKELFSVFIKYQQ